MSKTIEMPDELYDRLEEAAATEGLTPLEWLDAKLPLAARVRAECDKPGPRTMAERLAGRLGRIGSVTGQPSSADVSDSFGEYLEAKQRAGRL
jgi:hypothetical protein